MREDWTAERGQAGKWLGKPSLELTLTYSRVFLEKRMGQEVAADSLGDEWKGYVLRVTGGNDKQASWDHQIMDSA